MPGNFVAAMACGRIIPEVSSACGCIGSPILFGEPGSCKLEALKCTLTLFGADKSHIFNSQTTRSLILEALKNTTLPSGLDDSSEKGQEMWKELVIQQYISRRDIFFPIFTANWRFPCEKKRVHTRCIVLPFFNTTMK